MNLCFPIEKDEGLKSMVCRHFGSAPKFLIVNSETKEFETVENSNQHHSHGMCKPLQVIDGKEIDGIVLRGIGAGALQKLKSSGIKVFQAKNADVLENLEDFESKNLEEMNISNCAGHHGHC